ncbi:MAG: hypothetical protein ACRD3C_01050 [Vicinamibacterales bacterium]
MTSETPDSGVPTPDDPDLGPPVTELRDLALTVGDRFSDKVRGKIERRLVSQFVGRTVTRAAEESGIEFARSLGNLVSGFILFVVGVMAVGQLRFGTEMVRIVTICTLSAFALAFGLSVGLGARDITRNVLAGFYARKIFSPGDRLAVRGERGVLKAITATQILIEQETGLVAVANSAFLDETVGH